MKLQYLFGFSIILCHFTSFSELAGQSHTITVEIVNVKNNNGIIRIGVYDTEVAYESNRYIYGTNVPSEEGVQAIELNNIPSGTYAFKLYHDEDGDNELDKNFFGIPKEGYAMSNNAKAGLGAPEFEEAKFVLNSDVLQKIKINY